MLRIQLLKEQFQSMNLQQLMGSYLRKDYQSKVQDNPCSKFSEVDLLKKLYLLP